MRIDKATHTTLTTSVSRGPLAILGGITQAEAKIRDRGDFNTRLIGPRRPPEVFQSSPDGQTRQGHNGRRTERRWGWSIAPQA